MGLNWRKFLTSGYLQLSIKKRVLRASIFFNGAIIFIILFYATKRVIIKVRLIISNFSLKLDIIKTILIVRKSLKYIKIGSRC